MRARSWRSPTTRRRLPTRRIRCCRWFACGTAVIETELAGPRAADARWRAIHWRYSNEQFAYLAQRVVEQTCVALGPRRRAPHRTPPARAGRRRRVQRESHAAGPPAAGRGGRLRVSSHGRRRAGARRGDGGRGRGRTDRSSSISSRLDLGPGYDAASIEQSLRAAGLTAARVPNLAVPRRRSARRRAGRHVVSGRAWNTVPARSGIAASSPGPTVAISATA